MCLRLRLPLCPAARRRRGFSNSLALVCRLPRSVSHSILVLLQVLLAIVSPESRRKLGELSVGEVWVSSGSKTYGYYNQPEKNKESFQAVISGDVSPVCNLVFAFVSSRALRFLLINLLLKESSGVTYLRTGDLGFTFRGELFVTGRWKDIIIIGGRNYGPQDIEYVAGQ